MPRISSAETRKALYWPAQEGACPGGGCTERYQDFIHLVAGQFIAAEAHVLYVNYVGLGGGSIGFTNANGNYEVVIHGDSKSNDSRSFDIAQLDGFSDLTGGQTFEEALRQGEREAAFELERAKGLKSTGTPIEGAGWLLGAGAPLIPHPVGRRAAEAGAWALRELGGAMQRDAPAAIQSAQEQLDMIELYYRSGTDLTGNDLE